MARYPGLSLLTPILFVLSLATTTLCQLSTPLPLRILPLGDSITWGYLSTTGAGYRLPLLNLLLSSNITTDVLYVGSQHSGDFPNNANEGWPGYHIAQIAQKALLSLPDRPNVILLMAGTNDIVYNDTLSGMPDRLGSLIDECVQACPDATVLVAQLTPLAAPGLEPEVETYNAAIPAVVQHRVQAGAKALVVNMQEPGFGLTMNDLEDGTHPNDNGYAKMANIWMQGMQNVSAMGWLTPPVKAVVNGTEYVNATSAAVSTSGAPTASATAVTVKSSAIRLQPGVLSYCWTILSAFLR